MAAIAERHADSSAAALADSLAALTLGRLGSCSLTFRERMQAEEAAFLGARRMHAVMRRPQGLEAAACAADFTLLRLQAVVVSDSWRPLTYRTGSLHISLLVPSAAGTVETARSAAGEPAATQRPRRTRRTAATGAAEAATTPTPAAPPRRSTARGRRAADTDEPALADISNAGADVIHAEHAADVQEDTAASSMYPRQWVASTLSHVTCLLCRLASPASRAARHAAARHSRSKGREAAGTAGHARHRSTGPEVQVGRPHTSPVTQAHSQCQIQTFAPIACNQLCAICIRS